MSLDIADNIRHHGFKRLLLAVSGGLDSICLAHYLAKNREALGIEWLGIAHVHHGLREGTADRDADFVEAFAKSLGVPFFLKKLDGMALKSAEGSLEENARKARYRALFEIALDPILSLRSRTSTRLQDDTSLIPHYPLVIVTAHHAGDQAETLYMRIRRGTTLAGLRGMQAIRSLSNVTLEALRADRVHNALDPIPYRATHSRVQDDITIYRPFLNVTRSDLLAYARENNLTWCEDESNSDVKFARNRIRHQLLPFLESECPGAVKQLCRIAGLAERAYRKVVDAGEAIFSTALQNGSYPIASLQDTSCSRMTSENAETILSLDKKKLRKVLVAHESADLSEVFRLWLTAQGLRFPIGFFYDSREPAHVKIPHHAVYRKRALCKIGPTVQIREFLTPEEAQKFVSCGSTKKHVEKDKNEPS